MHPIAPLYRGLGQTPHAARRLFCQDPELKPACAGDIREGSMRIIHPVAWRPRLRAIALTTAVFSAACAGSGLSAEITVDELKSDYLTCEGASAVARQGDGEIMRCSMVYEELKRRGFDGDSRRLRTWHRATKSRRLSTSGRATMAAG
jgi:hypothetical protein